MRKGYDLLKKMVLLIDPAELFVILSFAQAEMSPVFAAAGTSVSSAL